MSWVVRMLVVLPALAAAVGLLVATAASRSPPAWRSARSASVAVLGFIQWVAPSRH